MGHINAAGVRGVPRPLGITDDGREVLSFVEGTGADLSDACVGVARIGVGVFCAAVAATSRRRPEVWTSTVLGDPQSASLPRSSATTTSPPTTWSSTGNGWSASSTGTSLPQALDSGTSSTWPIGLFPSRRPIGQTASRARNDVSACTVRLSAAYGTDADPREVSALLQQRLLDLAGLGELMALRLDKPELSDHATLYRHDVAHLPDT